MNQVMAICPTTWAFFGNFTDVIGFHNSQLSHFFEIIGS